MTVRNFGRQQAALALAATALAAGAPVAAQDTATPSRPIDFRLPPAPDEGRAPDVQGPSDNGLPPVAKSHSSTHLSSWSPVAGVHPWARN